MNHPAVPLCAMHNVRLPVSNLERVSFASSNSASNSSGDFAIMVRRRPDIEPGRNDFPRLAPPAARNRTVGGSGGAIHGERTKSEPIFSVGSAGYQNFLERRTPY
jgi:hypothetical protein